MQHNYNCRDKYTQTVYHGLWYTPSTIRTMHDNIFFVSQRGFTALHWAIEHVNHSVIAVLLQCGASLTIRNKVRLCSHLLATYVP